MPQKPTLTSCRQCVLAHTCVISDLVERCPQSVAGTLQHQRHRSGDWLLTEGEATDSLQVVKTGLIMLGQSGHEGVNRPLALVGRGHTLGARALSQAPALMWARAQSDVAVCRLHLPSLQGACEPARQALLPDLYARTLLALTDWTQVVRVAKLRARVLAALGLLVKAQGGGGRILLPRQADLAELLCITRESLGRTMRALEAEGVYTRIDRRHADVALPTPALTPQ
jgi:CRP-like cAMP-binding protein